ncbi:hypothetical protein DV735_g4889, partial [Chaetothyriales sp. CBS 134920]
MADSAPIDTAGRPINLVPVSLREAAIDSPSARATIAHYGEQIDLLERWLDDYCKAAGRVVAEAPVLDNILTNFTSQAVVPVALAESIIDHDYDVVAMRKYAEGAKDFWMSIISVAKRLSTGVVEPIRVFLANDVRAFKDARKAVDSSQKNFDTLHAKFAGLAKAKEPSSLREEAFQLHEARKQYLRAMMDLTALAPQFRFALDKLLVKVFYDQWKEMRASRESAAATFQRSASDMDRVRSWLSEMETSEKAFRRELTAARKQLEEAAEAKMRPSRELEDYTFLHQGSHSQTPTTAALTPSPRKGAPAVAEKQGYLYLRTYSGRPTRTVWLRRWTFLRNGVFGWLLQGARPGEVVESERIGVLLCSVRPAAAEERRFCFELKTNKHTILLQAESQAEMMAWITAVQTAKSKALEDPGAIDTLALPGRPHSDPAFAISPPPIPELGTLILGSTEPGTSAADELPSSSERSNTLPLPDQTRDSPSVDLPRRTTASIDDQGHTSRLLNKLTSKSTSATAGNASSAGAGGIASLIVASHGSMPVGPSLSVAMANQEADRLRNGFILALRDMPSSTLAPPTLANTPTQTSLSKSAVIVTGERGLSGGLDKAGLPNSLVANIWGCSNTAFVNRLDGWNERAVSSLRAGSLPALQLASPESRPKPGLATRPERSGTVSAADLVASSPLERSRSASPTKRARNMTISAGTESSPAFSLPAVRDFPSYYPLQLKSQDAQFRLLFPTARPDERVVMVFRASWNPNDLQDFPGRVYVTARDMYFYSNHIGLVLASTLSLSSIDEATAAPGRECDFLFLHMKEGGTRITIKTFLDPLGLLQRRINFLVRNSTASEPLSLEELIKALVRMESEPAEQSPSLESWEDVPPDTPSDPARQTIGLRGPSYASRSEYRVPVRVEHGLKPGTAVSSSKFKLPAQPVKYTPPGNLLLAVEREFDVSPKALFHVMFGDKAALWQLLQYKRGGRNVNQGPWMNLGEARLRRDFEFVVATTNVVGLARTVEVRDYQTADVLSEHLCYVVTDKRTPWYLPMQQSHRLVSKIVITHVAKRKCKLAVFVKVEWLRTPLLAVFCGLVERQGLNDLQLDAVDLADLVADQVRTLGAHSMTKKAIQLFGPIGQTTQIAHLHNSGGDEATASGVAIGRPAVPRTLPSLLLHEAGLVARSGLALILTSLLKLAGFLARVLAAHKLLLFALAISLFYNAYHTSRGGLQSFREASAVRFLHRLGVSDSIVLSRAVYLADLNAAVAAPSLAPDDHGHDLFTHTPDATTCYHVFADEYTRQRIALRRHDLLTAMRVVNAVEREVVRSEWDRWVAAEAARCRASESEQ